MSGWLHRLLLVAWASLAVLTLGAPAAAARPFAGVIARGIPSGSGTLPFRDACGVALDPAGRVYVSDYYRGHVEVFSAYPAGPFESGAPLVDFLTRIPSAEEENSPCELAIDSVGDLYANNWHRSVVKHVSGTTLTIDSDRATGVAVDPVSDRVYVAHRTYISAYEPDGSPVLSGGLPLRIGVGSLADGYGLAVSDFAATRGRLYVADAGEAVVKAFDPAGDPSAPVQVITGAATPRGGFGDLVDSDLAVDDTNGHLLVVDNLQPGREHPEAVVDEFGVQGSYLGQLPRALVHAQPSGLAVDGSGNVLATSGDEQGAIVYAFGPASTAPTRLLEVGSIGSGAGTVGSTPAGVACGSACVGEFALGTTVTLTAADDGHSAFRGWTVAGDPGACPGTGPCQLTLGSDTDVEVEFEALPQRALTVSKSGDGLGTVASAPFGVECAPDCAAADAEFNAGSTVTLTATPAPHSAFRGWTVVGDPGACPGTGPCEMSLAADTEVGAEFEVLPQRTLIVDKGGAGRGTVVSEPAGIECGPSCAAAFDLGSTVTLAAAPAQGSVFSGWSGAGCAGTGPCHIAVGADTRVVATFAPATALPPAPLARGDSVLAISLSGSGTGVVSSEPGGIDCGTPCSSAYAPGSTVTLTARPDPGSRFADWSGCDSAAGDRCTVNLGASRAVGAAFEEVPTLELVAVTSRGAVALLEMEVPGPGILTATAKRLVPAGLNAKRAGTVELRLALNRAGRRSLAKEKRLKVRTRVSFRPSGGGESIRAAKVVTFRRGGKGR